MNRSPLESLVTDALGEPVQIARDSILTGGCIHDTRLLTCHNGTKYVVKLADDRGWPMLLAERDGLLAIAATATVRTPRVLGAHWSSAVGRGALVLEWIETAPQTPEFVERFAEALAALHQFRLEMPGFGFHSANFLGATPQPNAWRLDWVEFWRQHRLGYQWNRARQSGRSTPQLNQMLNRISGRLDQILPRTPQVSLLHGDLWSGNFLCDVAQEPVLIDPAVYCGDREAEWGMLLWLGGLPPRFQQVYNQIFPLESGFPQRVLVYQLYHLLNHVNLFGSGYLAETIEVASQIAKRLA